MEKCMVFPVTGGSVDSVDLMWIRQDWLDKFDLEIPQTMDELLTVIDKFTNEDPDGDGENNTYGIGVAGSPKCIWRWLWWIEGILQCIWCISNDLGRERWTACLWSNTARV